MTSNYNAGDVYEIDYPFQALFDCPWGSRWQPGCRSEHVYPDDSELVSDAMGKMVVSIVDVHKPGKYPTRIYFTRQWKDPDGKVFGKTGLHIKTCQWLTKRLDGFHYKFRMATQDELDDIPFLKVMS